MKTLNEIISNVIAGATANRQRFDAAIAGLPKRKHCPKHSQGILFFNEDAALKQFEINGKINPDKVWTVCPHCMTEEAEAAGLRLAGVPEILSHCRLDNWTPTTDQDYKRLEKVKTYAAKPRGFLLLIGPEYGTGKTHLAVAVLRANRGGRFIRQNEFLRMLREEYNTKPTPGADIISICSTVPLLVFDEMGLSGGGRDELPALHEVLNRRYSDYLPTILTGNLAPDQLENVIGQRMADRLQECLFASIQLTGKTFRPSRRADYLDKNPKTK